MHTYHVQGRDGVKEIIMIIIGTDTINSQRTGGWHGGRRRRVVNLHIDVHYTNGNYLSLLTRRHGIHPPDPQISNSILITETVTQPGEEGQGQESRTQVVV